MHEKSLKNIASKRILITGDTGFIGRHLARRLLELGAEVYGISRTQTKPSEEILWRHLDIDLCSFDDLCLGTKRIRPEIVIHLAGNVSSAQNPELIMPMLEGNLLATVNLLRVIKMTGCEKIMLLGTSDEFKNTPDSSSSSPYAVAKEAVALYAKFFHQHYDMPITIVRPFYIYGPGQPQSKLIPYTILSFLKKESPKLTSGETKHDFVYIDDIVNGLLKTATTPGLAGESIELGSGQVRSIREVIETITTIIPSSSSASFGALNDRYAQNMRAANLYTAKKLIDWEPVTDIHSGLTYTIDWYKQKFHCSEK